jgi:F0F1-type ATP synthase assembly protein I
MSWIIFAKILGAGLAWNLYTFSWCTSAVAAALIGVLPICLSFLAAKMFKKQDVLPSNKLNSAAVAADIAVFIISPVVFLSIHSFSVEINLATALFFLFGLARSLRILKDGRFVGLPIAYTGLIWAPIIYLEQSYYPLLGAFLVVATSFAMIRYKEK